MTLALFVGAMMLGLMMAEARVSARHERVLAGRGATRPREPQYPIMAAAYPAAFIALIAEGALRHVGPSPLFASGVVMFLGAKALKYWAIGTLGERWTFRVMTLPGVPLVRTGPYKYVAHPNYLAVIGELAGAAMTLRAVIAGPIALVGFGILVWRRVAFEARALEQAAPRLPSGSVRS